MRSREDHRIMEKDHVTPTSRASQLQEAIDAIVQSFDHPAEISIDYRADHGQKQTIFDILASDGDETYELVYDGRDDAAEPELTQVD